MKKRQQSAQEPQELDSEVANWGAQEFASANIGDARLNARLIAVAEAFMQKPGASVPKASASWAGAKGVYRFFDNGKVNSQNILSPHTESTKRRIEGRELVLAIQDTSTIDYSTRDATDDIGPAGNRLTRGLMLHPTLAVTPEGTPLGILDLQIWNRPDNTWSSELTREERRNTPLEDKESMKWINSYRKVCEIQKEMNDKVHFVNVCDREGDMYDLFLEHHKLSTENPPDLLVRAAKDRKLAGDSGFLWDFMESIDVFGEYDIQVQRKVGKKAREATLQIRFSKITMRRPFHRYPAKENPSFDLYAVYTCEKNPPQKEEGISWMLLTTMPVLTFEDAVEKVEWYTDRWIIETFFKVLKSGCKIENRQMKTGARLMSCITVDSIIAWRILFLTFIGRELPDLSAEIVFEPHEWQSLHCRINNTSELPNTVPSLYTVMIQIAKLGGFLARKSDGFPGPFTIFQGVARPLRYGRRLQNPPPRGYFWVRIWGEGEVQPWLTINGATITTVDYEYDTEGNRFIKRTDLGGIVTEIHDLSSDYRVHADGSSEVHTIEIRNGNESVARFRFQDNLYNSGVWAPSSLFGHRLGADLLRVAALEGCITKLPSLMAYAAHDAYYAVKLLPQIQNRTRLLVMLYWTLAAIIALAALTLLVRNWRRNPDDGPGLLPVGVYRFGSILALLSFSATGCIQKPATEDGHGRRLAVPTLC